MQLRADQSLRIAVSGLRAGLVKFPHSDNAPFYQELAARGWASMSLESLLSTKLCDTFRPFVGKRKSTYRISPPGFKGNEDLIKVNHPS